jgi:thioesterase domain-containing protein
MELYVMLTGILIGAAAASLVAVGWAASRLRWLDAHCSHQIAYWRNEASRARAAAGRLREQQAAGRPGSRAGSGRGA